MIVRLILIHLNKIVTQFLKFRIQVQLSWHLYINQLKLFVFLNLQSELMHTLTQHDSAGRNPCINFNSEVMIQTTNIILCFYDVHAIYELHNSACVFIKAAT